MSNRIQPECFVKVWNGLDGFTHQDKLPRMIDFLFLSVTCGAKPIALFLVRPKTPQEQANSIYYPKPTNK